MVRRGIRYVIPATIASWVFENHSLTARLRREVSPHFKVNVLTHSWQKPYRDEAKLLDQPFTIRSLVREVRLESNGMALIVARTIIPSDTLIGAHRRLSHLGTRPLGEVIFSYPQLKRIHLSCAHVPPDYWIESALEKFDIDKNIWGRRTLYSIGGPKLLVCEFFLPVLFKSNNA